jgi:SAM-dependent methyltransferase
MELGKEIITERDILIGVINRFIGLISNAVRKGTSNKTDEEYPFIAMDTRQVFEQLLFVSNYVRSRDGLNAPLKFLDIGCGFGNVLLFAEQFDFEVFGLEKDEASLEVALKLFEPHQIIREDLREFSGYGDFDILYYFCPLAEGEREFELLVEDEIKEGAILIANYKRSKDIYSDSRFLRLSEDMPIWGRVS